MKLVFDHRTQSYHWQLNPDISSPLFVNESDAKNWYFTLEKYFCESRPSKKNLPKLLTKF
jgi:hypothetical protein